MRASYKLLLAGLTSASALAFVAGWEGHESKPYYDIAGVLTVCNGYTGSDIDKNKVYGKKECDSLLKQELTVHGKAVLACVKVPLNQNQYNAFVSLAYNVGAPTVCQSGLPKNKHLIDVLNEGDYTAACDRILAYNKARVKGKLVPVFGLTKRRQAERAMCLTPITPANGGPQNGEIAIG